MRRIALQRDFEVVAGGGGGGEDFVAVVEAEAGEISERVAELLKREPDLSDFFVAGEHRFAHRVEQMLRGVRFVLGESFEQELARALIVEGERDFGFGVAPVGGEAAGKNAAAIGVTSREWVLFESAEGFADGAKQDKIGEAGFDGEAFAPDGDARSASRIAFGMESVVMRASSGTRRPSRWARIKLSPAAQIVPAASFGSQWRFCSSEP